MNPRTPLLFTCAGETLAATLHPACGPHALLLMQGGGQIRAGPHGSFTRLADHLQQQGFPVLRFDRRGIGDSSGSNQGWHGASEDIMAATRALRAALPHVQKISALGLCDGASALLCAAHTAEFASLILINPWTLSESDTSNDMPAPLLRQRYWQRLRNFYHWGRVLRGELPVRALFTALQKLGRSMGRQTISADPDVARAWARYRGPRLVLLSPQDKIAAYGRAWLAEKPVSGGLVETVELAEADHSLSRAGNVAAAAAVSVDFLHRF